MWRKHVRRLVMCCCAVLVVHDVLAQDAFEKYLLERIDSMSNVPANRIIKTGLYPNDAMQGLMVPTGWGGYKSYVFVSMGVAYPQVYSNNIADFITSAGFGVGDPYKLANFSASVNVLDLDRLTNLSYNFSLSRFLGRSSSITVGGLQVFADKKRTDAPEPTFYVAFSHAVQALPSKTPGYSRLSFTIGAGTGRFLLKSLSDSISGKGEYGTAAFASVSYEVISRLNINAEWDGLNLGVSLGTRPFNKIPLSIGAGVTNLTKYSGDKPFFVLSIGYSLSLIKS